MKAFIIFTIMALTGLAQSSDNALEDYALSNEKLTIDLYKEFANASMNVVYSPLSAQLVLSLTQLGAKGKTAEELGAALNLPSDPEKIKQAVKELQTTLQEKERYTLNSVNKLYLKTGYEIKLTYIDIVKNIFSADIENVNFSERESTAKKINQYVEDKTEKLIKDVVSPDQLDDLTRLVLVNTMFLKVNWSLQFNQYTAPTKFHASIDEAKEIKLMTRTSYFEYADVPELDAKALRVPYKGNDVHLTILLPNKIEGLGMFQGQMEKVFGAKNWTLVRVNFSFPKIKVESTLDLKEALQNIGVQELFDDHKADLSEIAKPGPPLYVSDVIQKAFVKFTESGTTAAAATLVFVGVPYSSLPPPEPIPFTVDRPFFFYISKGRFNLFAGRVIAPEFLQPEDIKSLTCL